MKLIFCLPGKTFSLNFFNSWNATINTLASNGINYGYCIGYDPVVYYARNKVLGGINTAGKKQKPWQGQVAYDKMVWIDSDIVWTSDQLLSLISHTDKSIVAGLYHMENGIEYPVVESLDYSQLHKQGSFEFLTNQTVSKKTSPFTVSYTGFGFVAINHGVIESMEYPWFRPKWVEHESFYDFCAEDVGFCWEAQSKGHSIWIDPSIKVGHEKNVII